ncbi:GTP pyrophosphokinase [Herpetosiphon giganteus]|nr:GTP pyrophosphokinase [Herpetosiphon giganteus]
MDLAPHMPSSYNDDATHSESTKHTTATPASSPQVHESEALISRMRTYWPLDEFQLIERAWDVAKEAHAPQVRKSGEPYFLHPVQVAHILVDMKLDPESVAAALLHDVVEDTPITLDQIRADFGREVAHIVDGVTKLSKLEAKSIEEAQAITYRKMFIAMADDPRVVLIKLADRLHNMRTLGAMRPDKQQRIARETLEVYAPLAHRLGIWQFKWELEDLSFRYMNPEKYSEIGRQLNLRRETRERIVQRVIARLKQILDRDNIKAEVTGRPKHIYSIARKMERKGVSLDQIYDQLAVRVMVTTVDECYRVLGLVHSTWIPIMSEFDDYIAVPKESMYRSLHTTVVIPGEQPCEVQIRTYEMHEVSEYGIAAHWRYKEGFGNRNDQSFETKLAWLRSAINGQRDLDPTEFFESVKEDVLRDQVFVLTPKGKIIDLPKGSSPIDFAYRIHSEVGNRCIGARVNNKPVPLYYQLQHGEIVDVVTSKVPRGPSRDWLEYVKSNGARTHIKRWFRRQENDVNITAGRELIEKELKRLGVRPTMEELLRANAMKNSEDFLAAIGNGDLSPRQAIQRVLSDKNTDDEPLAAIPTIAPPAKPVKQGTITVRGEADVYTRIAHCCNPVYPEAVIGYTTRGHGITVHRMDCYNVLHERNRERLIDVEWGGATEKQSYPVPIRIEAWDRVGLWRDVTNAIADGNINIQAVQQLDNKHHGRATLLATIRIESIDQLSRILDKLNRVKDVIEARRENTVAGTMIG